MQFTRSWGWAVFLVPQRVAHDQYGCSHAALVSFALVSGAMDFFTPETFAPSAQRLETVRAIGRLASRALERVLESERQAEAAQDMAAVNQVLRQVSVASAREYTRGIADQTNLLALDATVTAILDQRSSLERRRSASGLPPVWQVGQYCSEVSAKLTSRTVSPQTGHGSPVRACTRRPERFSPFIVAAR